MYYLNLKTSKVDRSQTWIPQPLPDTLPHFEAFLTYQYGFSLISPDENIDRTVENY